jgi:hypothetical protein
MVSEHGRALLEMDGKVVQYEEGSDHDVSAVF